MFKKLFLCIAAAVLPVALVASFMQPPAASVIDPVASTSGMLLVCESGDAATEAEYFFPMPDPPGKGTESWINVFSSPGPRQERVVPPHSVYSNITACEAWISIVPREDNALPYYGAPLAGQQVHSGGSISLSADLEIQTRGGATVASENNEVIRSSAGEDKVARVRITDELGEIDECHMFVLKDIDIEVFSSSNTSTTPLDHNDNVYDDCALVLYGTSVYYDLVLPYEDTSLSLRNIAQNVFSGLV